MSYLLFFENGFFLRNDMPGNTLPENTLIKTDLNNLIKMPGNNVIKNDLSKTDLLENVISIDKILDYKIINLEHKAQGSFGNIIKAKLQVSNYTITLAIKKIEKNSIYGMNSIMECYIMLHIQSNFLTKAIRIDIDNMGNCQIMQPLAVCDMAEYIKKNKTENNLKKWFWQLVCGIAHLHSNGILHCDIKCKNILIYENDNIALTDFGLSKMIINPEIGTRIGNAYTLNYRPIEVLKHINYSFPADIWALGCTLFEIKYGFSYLPYPSSSHTGSSNLNEQYINMILNMTDMKFDENDEYDMLTKNMLNVNSKDRIEIWDIINSPYFQDMDRSQLPENLFFPDFKFTNFNGNNVVEKFADYILLKTGGKFEICKIISNKILHGKNEIRLKYKDLEEEIKICKSVNFNFYPS